MSAARRFGTIGGVFVPNVLTILGVILFLRTGWVVGTVGLYRALLILVLANGITLLTALSLSAISTNTQVGAGGAYYLISRSLGLEIGGGLGVPLYFAQAISVAFYCIGFAESVQLLWPDVDERVVASGVLLFLVAIAWIGADLAVKTQYAILAILIVSLGTFFAGFAPLEGWMEATDPVDSGDARFWTVFAIFFPAVTGITAGVSMSGELKDPGRAIPRGTLGAVVLTFIVYVVVMVALAMTATVEELRTDSLVMRRVAIYAPLIFAGLWAATLSSALASLVAAPRTLQALARDRVAPRLFARGFGAAKEPRFALALSVVLAEVCILSGNLDVIAPVITMFFLTTYGMLNLVAGLEMLVANPTYRPTFRVHWLVSLVGALSCLAVMFLLNATATIVATLFIFIIYLLLTRMRFQTQWGDMRSGFWFAATRLGLMRFTASHQHVHNWRPVVLVLSGNPEKRKRLVQFAQWIESRRGLIFLGQVYAGGWDKLIPRRESLQEQMETFIAKNRLAAVAQTVVAESFEEGVVVLMQTAGLGHFQPNTVLAGWSDDTTRTASFQRTVRKVLQLRRNLLLYRYTDLPQSALAPTIDIWWFSRANSTFMLTLAHLIQTNARWSDHKIRVLRHVQSEAGRAEIKEKTSAFLKEARIEAQVLVRVSDGTMEEAIVDASGRSGILFLALPDEITLEPPTESDEEGDEESEEGAERAGMSSFELFPDLLAELKGHVFLTKSWQELEM
ncbi:MAG: hypothetical protein AAF682_08390 [Planctomycetota bacterium]